MLLAFLVVSRIAANYLNEAGAVAGGVAVGVMMFGLAPVQKAAERLADKALPQVNDSAEYLTFKKLEVYQAAVESAAQWGRIDDRGRALLDELARRLALQPHDAAAVERDVMTTLSIQPLSA
jgi:uncharacterized membrane protein YebE (DUF533 family)